MLVIKDEIKSSFVDKIDQVVENMTKLVYLADRIQNIFVEEMLSSSDTENKVLNMEQNEGKILN